MGTHPIFESDFDCLTEMVNNDESENFISESPVDDGVYLKSSTKVPKTLSITHILLALGSIGLCIAWVVKNYSGFTLDNGTYHFLLMTLFIIFTSVGATSFRIFTFVSRPVAKLIHAGCLTASFIIASVSLWTIFKFHNDKNIPNMYTLHSWLGLVFVILFGLQLMGGLFSFLFPLVSPAVRSKILPVHRASGIILFTGIAGIAMIGINEKLVFEVGKYKVKDAFGIIPNIFGLILFLFAAVGTFILVRPEYKREENRSQAIPYREHVSSASHD